MTSTQAMQLPDVQSRQDARGIAIDMVGVRDVRYPIAVLDKAGGLRETVGLLSLSVSLPHDVRGTHMSRFIEILNESRHEITMRTLPVLLGILRDRLKADRARVEVRFPYFVERRAPASGAEGIVDYDCTFIAEGDSRSYDFVLGVRVPVTTLCPCSKEISDYGAHNQRSDIQIYVRSIADDTGTPRFIWIEEVIEWAEAAGSSPVYSVLKRVDERHVTMQAYDRPAFVEDVVRAVGQKLQEDARVAWYAVEAVNHESIHNHNAFASITWRR